MQRRLCVEPGQQVKIGFFDRTKPYVLVACDPFRGSIGGHSGHLAVVSAPCRSDCPNISSPRMSAMTPIAAGTAGQFVRSEIAGLASTIREAFTTASRLRSHFALASGAGWAESEVQPTRLRDTAFAKLVPNLEHLDSALGVVGPRRSWIHGCITGWPPSPVRSL